MIHDLELLMRQILTGKLVFASQRVFDGKLRIWELRAMDTAGNSAGSKFATRRARGVNEIAPDNRRDVKVGRANST